MKQVYVLAEGQTEERLVTLVLQPALADKDIWLTPVTLKTRRADGQPHDRGGVSRWTKIAPEIHRLLRNPSVHTVTTLMDFYGIPSDTPGMSDQPSGDVYARVGHVEQAMDRAIGNPRFLAFLALHETEAWVLAAANELAAMFGRPKLADELKAQVEEAGGPELVNNGPATAPSKRIERAYPGYRKVADGPDAIARLGLQEVRNSCPHFDEWLTRLEAAG